MWVRADPQKAEVTADPQNSDRLLSVRALRVHSLLQALPEGEQQMKAKVVAVQPEAA